MVRIVVSRLGKVDDEDVKDIIDTMQECYGRLLPHDVSIVELYIFQRSSALEAFFAKERGETGVVTDFFAESFFAMHDAWRGTPRITICLERMDKLPELVKIGGIRHEVGHSVLHGSLQYYLLPFPPSLVKIASHLSFPDEYSGNLLYLFSIAVKDYEVTRLLYERGYVEDQVAYARFMLKTSEDDMFAWKISKGKPFLEALYLVSCLKALGCVVPLLNDAKMGILLKQELEESLNYLPTDHFHAILKIVEEAPEIMEMDTLRNIDNFIRKCSPLFDAIFKS